MSLLIDTNILLYAANSRCAEHTRARSCLERRLSAAAPLCLTWGVLYEFFRVATHARVFPAPLSAAQALAFAGALLDREEVTVLAPTSRHWDLLNKTLRELSRPAGNLFHDIETAVLMREHGIREIATADTDFLQFPFLKVVNPLL